MFVCNLCCFCLLFDLLLVVVIGLGLSLVLYALDLGVALNDLSLLVNDCWWLYYCDVCLLLVLLVVLLIVFLLDMFSLGFA